MTSFKPVLHGLRGAAALAVLAFHLGSLFPHLQGMLNVRWFDTTLRFSLIPSFGWLGVYLFFVLSGYLLASQLRGRVLTGRFLLAFWLRRVLRIYPAFWLQLIALVAVSGHIDGLPWRMAGWSLVRHTVLWLNLPPWMTHPSNNVWWTLPIELSFYLVLPLLVPLARRLGWPGMLAACIAVTLAWRFGVLAVFRGTNYSDHLSVLDSLPGTVAIFAAGVAIAHIDVQPSRRMRSVMLVLGCVLIYAMTQWLLSNIGTYWTGHWMLAVWPSLMAAILATIMYALMDPPWCWRWLSWRPMTWLGEVSYGIYLWHLPAFYVVLRFKPLQREDLRGSIVAAAAGCVITLVLASISYYMLEKPAMRWGSRWVAAREGSRPPVPSHGSPPVVGTAGQFPSASSSGCPTT